MSVEIELSVDGRTLLIDIEPNTLQGLKNEFDEYCNEDEALRGRRQSWAPAYSMYDKGGVLKEVKRKHIFTGGEQVFVQWISLNLQVPNEPETPKTLLYEEAKMSETTNTLSRQPEKKGTASKDSEMVHQNKEKDILLPSKEPENKAKTNNSKDNQKDSKLVIKKTENSNTQGKDGCYSKGNSSEVTGKGENDGEKEKSSSEDSEDYGLVKEYVTEDVWKKLPKYLKERERNRFNLHEQGIIQGIVKVPFEINTCGVSTSSNSSPTTSPSKTGNKKSRTRKRNRVMTSDSGSADISNYSENPDSINSEASSASNNESGSKNVLRPSNRLSTPSTARNAQITKPSTSSSSAQIPKPSTSGAHQSTFSTSSAGSDNSEIMKMKPHLPRYNIPKILKKIGEGGNDAINETIEKLNENGILTGNERRLLIRVLVRHLFFKIAKDPKQATPDMREGLAKSIVLDYPKFQDSYDGKNTYPWKSLFDRQGRGWIANSARAIQRKHRTKKSVKRRKKDSSNNGETENEDVSDTEIQALALLMPGRAEKGEILDGMKRTFSVRQAARSRQVSVREMLEKFPHLANYDGEVLQEEFKRLRPNAQDMSLNFQKKMPNIIALGTPDRVSLPLENDAFKALLIMSKKLPRDIRTKSDPKGKSTTANFQDIVEIVQLGQDIDAFVSDKVTDADGPIQPYLIMVRSPVRNSIVKCFLILDQKPVQLSTTSILKSLEFLLKSYFIFNVNYPLGWRGVFHCLSTCFANIFEDRGSRKRPDSCTPSERDFMNSIKDPSE